jgi:hypothetical protein
MPADDLIFPDPNEMVRQTLAVEPALLPTGLVNLSSMSYVTGSRNVVRNSNYDMKNFASVVLSCSYAGGSCCLHRQVYPLPLAAQPASACLQLSTVSHGDLQLSL